MKIRYFFAQSMSHLSKTKDFLLERKQKTVARGRKGPNCFLTHNKSPNVPYLLDRVASYLKSKTRIMLHAVSRSLNEHRRTE